MTMIPTRDPQIMINLSRAADGAFLLRIGAGRFGELDRRNLEALSQAIGKFLSGHRVRTEIPTRDKADTITLHYAEDGDYVLRVGGGRFPARLERSDLESLCDAVKQLLAQRRDQIA
jgi:hypothetical protein